MSSLTDDNGNKTTWTYNSLGRKLTETKGDYVSPGLADRKNTPTTIFWTYNLPGTVATQTKEDGTILHYEYDDLNRPTRIYSTNGVYGEQLFHYDGAGWRIYACDKTPPMPMTMSQPSNGMIRSGAPWKKHCKHKRAAPWPPLPAITPPMPVPASSIPMGGGWI